MGSRPIAGGDVVREAAELSAMAWQLFTLLKGLKAFSYGPLPLLFAGSWPTGKTMLIAWRYLEDCRTRSVTGAIRHGDTSAQNEGYYYRCSKSHSTHLKL